MWLELCIKLTASLLLATVMVTIGRIVLNKLAIARFKKISRNMPMCDDERLFDNHTSSVMFGQNNCLKLKAMHERLGAKTIGFLAGGNFCASTIDLDFIHSFVIGEPNQHMDRLKLGVPAIEFMESIFFAHKDNWHHRRRVIAPAMTSQKFKTPNVRQELEESIDKLVQYIERLVGPNESSKLIDVGNMAQKYASQLVAKCLYKQDDLVDFDDPHDFWVDLMDEGLRQVQTSSLLRLSVAFPFLQGPLSWLSLHLTEQGLARQTLLQFVDAQTRLGIRARKHLSALQSSAASDGDGQNINPDNFLLGDGTRFKRNLVDHIVDKYLDGKLTKLDYERDSCFLLAAANRTSSDCIEHTIYQLATNPHIQERLRRSIEEHGAESEYLEWVLRESLRVFPPAPIGCSRVIRRDMEVADGRHTVPANTYVHTNAFVIHRLKEYWGDDAEEFKPDRWRDTSHHHPLQYIPFGAGPRGCPGRAFAMHEMKMLFATLLKRYRFECERRENALDFDAPMFVFVVTRLPTHVTISRL